MKAHFTAEAVRRFNFEFVRCLSRWPWTRSSDGSMDDHLPRGRVADRLG